jgi:hypothetical protein
MAMSDSLSPSRSHRAAAIVKPHAARLNIAPSI